MKSMFLANMSHEIRTPMNGIIGFTELALGDSGVPEKTRDYLNKIHVSATNLLGIINDILDISKIEAGKVELEKTPFSIRDVLKNCEIIETPKAEEKGISLFLYAEPYMPTKLLGDPTKLQQVLLNLLSNAIKFTNSGIVKLMTAIEEEDGSYVTIHFEVKDSGIGMSPEQLQKIFAPFTQADSSTTRQYGGTVLGLAITKNIVELMGGRLNAISTPGVGSKFSFSASFEKTSLPLEIGREENNQGGGKYRKPLFQGHVLVCEDNKINQQVVEEHLSRVGLHAHIAENGKLGVEMVKAHMRKGTPFDIILMDIHMPVMDGFEATRQLYLLENKTPIIAMTTNAMSKGREKILQHGMFDYISKPFAAHELWSCLLRFLTPLKISEEEQPELVRGLAEGGLLHDEVINRALGLEQSAGNEALYERIQRDFLKTNQNTFQKLKDAIAVGDTKLAHYTVHTLKGVAGLLGAVRLQEIAAEIEKSLLETERYRRPKGVFTEGEKHEETKRYGCPKGVFTEGEKHEETERYRRPKGVFAEGEKHEEDSAGVTETQLHLLEISLSEVFNELGSLPEREKITYARTAELEKSELDKNKMSDLAARLIPLLKTGDSDALSLLDEIRETLSHFGESCGILAAQIDGYDFDPALETLNDIKLLITEV